VLPAGVPAAMGDAGGTLSLLERSERFFRLPA